MRLALLSWWKISGIWVCVRAARCLNMVTNLWFPCFLFCQKISGGFPLFPQYNMQVYLKRPIDLLLCPTLCGPTDCNPPGSSVHWISQAGIPECVAISSSRGSSWPQGLNLGFLYCRWICYRWDIRKALLWMTGRNWKKKKKAMDLERRECSMVEVSGCACVWGLRRQEDLLPKPLFLRVHSNFFTTLQSQFSDKRWTIIGQAFCENLKS